MVKLDNKISKNIRQDLQQSQQKLLANQDIVQLYTQFKQKRPNNPNTINQAFQDQAIFNKFVTFMFIETKASLINNKQIRDDYFKKYLLQSRQKALEYLQEKSSHQIDIQKEKFPAANIIDYLNEEENSTDDEEKPVQSTSKNSQNQQLGGINMNIEDFQVSGIIIDKQKESVDFIKGSNKSSNISMKDLSIGLAVFYDNSIKHKNISFSLDPYVETNPDGPYQRKVLYPDNLENRKIIAGTEFSDVLFEADYLLKKMSLGYENNNTIFKYPDSLKQKGLKSIQEFQDETIDEKQGKKQWSRLWFVCKDVLAKEQNGALQIYDVKIIIQAKIMTTDSKGKLVDAVLQDENDGSYKFAKKFSELYDDIASYYPILNKLKELYKAIALARYIGINQIPIDLKTAKKLLEKQQIKGYNDKIDTIQNSKTDIQQIEEKIEVDIRTVAIRSLEKQKYEVTEKNIEFAINQLQQKEPGKKYYDIKHIQRQQYRGVLGGVDMNFDIKPIKNVEKSFINLNIKEKNTSTSQQKQQQQQQQKQQAKPYKKIFDDQSSFKSEISTQIASQDIDIKPENRVPFIFSPQEKCSKCDQIIGMEELKYPINNIYYCQKHHPYSCYYCKTLATQNSLTVKSNSPLFEGKLKPDTVVNFHPDCMDQFQYKAQNKSIIQQQNQFALKVNEDVEKHIKKFDNSLSLEKIKLNQVSQFTCSLCKFIQKSNSLQCQRCKKADEKRINQGMQEIQQKRMQK